MGLFSPQVVGIDIGASSVKVVGVSLGKKPAFLGCKEIAVDPQYLQKEGFTNTALVGQALREALDTADPKKLTPSRAYLTISEAYVFRKLIELPPMEDPAEMRKAVALEIGQYLPQPVEDTELDYQPLGMVEDGSAMQVMVVAVPKRVVQEHLEVCKSAKLKVAAIDVKPAAVGRSVVPQSEKSALVVVDIGSEISTIFIYQENSIRVCDTVKLGANILKDPETGQHYETGLEGHITRLCVALADEITHALKFYENRTVKKAKMKGILLTGGGSQTKGIAAALEKEAGLSASLGHAVMALPPAFERQFLGALGSALYSRLEKV